MDLGHHNAKTNGQIYITEVKRSYVHHLRTNEFTNNAPGSRGLAKSYPYEFSINRAN